MSDTLLLSAEEMAELDRRTIEDLGVPGLVLMESAAWAGVEVALTHHLDELALGVVVVCGPGNNGGDGLAMARRLQGLGVESEAILVGARSRLSKDAAVQWEMAEAFGVRLREAPGIEPLGFASRSWVDRGLIVDALFGTGLVRPVEGIHAAAVEAIAAAREAGVSVLSVDIPSGVDATTGAVQGTAVQADTTVTFAALKLGHMLQPGRWRSGRIVCAEIGIPAQRWLDVTTEAARLAGPEDLLSEVAPGPRDAHKGSFGHLLVVAGSPGKTGAARLCTDAALRSGAGLVTLVVPESLSVDGLVAEAMLVRIPDGSWNAATILKLLEDRDALAIGPGIGMEPDTVFMARQLFAEAPVPAVFDADAINALVAAPKTKKLPKGERVITPHPGEFARLVRTDWPALAPRRLDVTREVAARLHTTVLLKGASSLIVDPSGHVTVNPTGNPGMGTAGSGDVLTGVVGALLGRGVPGTAAARAAAWWHGCAGDLAAASQGEPSLVAGDLIDNLGPAWRAAMDGDLPAPFDLYPAVPEP